MFAFNRSSEFAVTVPPTVKLPVEGLNVSFVEEIPKDDVIPEVIVEYPT
jgi:hypothetical protein